MGNIKSLKDIAKELGVTVSTVSRAYRGKDGVGESMRKKVLELAKKYNYVPNRFAVGLHDNCSRTIGVIIPMIPAYFYTSIIVGIDEAAKEQGFSIVIESSYESVENEKKCIENMLKLRVDGIIACISQETQTMEHFETLLENNIPVVFFDRGNLGERCSRVVIDNKESAKKAVNHLVERGCQRIALIGAQKYLQMSSDRREGYIEALEENRIPVRREYIIVPEKMSFKSGLNSTRHLLSLPEPPDAIMTMSDEITFAVLKEVKRHGLKIPKDIKVLGYVDEFHADIMDPSITSICHHNYDIGVICFNLIFKHIQNPQQKAKRVVVPSYLVARESTK